MALIFLFRHIKCYRYKHFLCLRPIRSLESCKTLSTFLFYIFKHIPAMSYIVMQASFYVVKCQITEKINKTGTND